MTHQCKLINIHEFSEVARAALDSDAWNYLDGAAEKEASKAINQEALRALRLVPRIFNNVDTRDQTTAILGETFSSPVVLAPTSPLRLFHEDAELAQMRAARSKNALAIYSTDAHYPLETAAEVGDGRTWFQLYAYGDRAATEEMLNRVKEAGFKSLVVTADAFYAGRRERMLASGFTMPSHVKMGNILHLQNDPKYLRADGSVRRLALTWADLKWIKAACDLPLVIKGVMHPDDALKSIDCGARAIIVSNHGGRQLDDTVSTLAQLAKVVDAVGAQAETLIDGGFYRGIDILKAIALGAKAVLVGRAYVQALAANGQLGIETMFDMFANEIDNAMSQLGVAKLSELDRSFLA